MSVARGRGFIVVGRALGGEFADRLEHGVAVVDPTEEALVDQLGDRVEVGRADRLGGG